MVTKVRLTQRSSHKASGGYWAGLDEEIEDAVGMACEEQPEAANLADDLLRRFVAAKGGAR